VHALEPPLPELSPDEVASVVAEARERLEGEWSAPLRAQGVSFRPWLEKGDPGEVISRVAGSVQPGCVVAGSRGLGPISQRLLGSVTHHLVGHLEWPTVVVPSLRDCVVWKV
jgi:nucleotide-binding universal stress UspA family protein